MTNLMHTWLAAVGAHPGIALIVVFGIACAEAIAFIGTVVPAGVVMFSAGALIGAGVLDGWITMLVAVAGAVTGDGISYELGRRYQQQVTAWWTRRGRASSVARGEQFIQRYGVKSIVLARFFAPVRAVVPFVVGCARMPRPTFYPVNVVSAIAWAPVHIAPGIVFGASTALAAAVSARLAAILIAVVALAWAVAFGVRVGIRDGIPLLRRASTAAMQTIARRWPRADAALRGFAARENAVSGTLAACVLLFVGSIWLFGGVLEDIVANDPLMRADSALYTFLQSLRTAPVDAVMASISMLSERGTGLVVAAAMFVWLIAQRSWRTAAYWILVVGVAAILVPDMGADTTPAEWHPGGMHTPSLDGDATFGVVAWGFIGWLLTRRQRLRWRIGIATVCACWIMLAGFARLYLGETWLSGLLGSWGLGLAWFAVIAGVYTYWQVREDVQPHGALPVLIVVLAAAGVWTAPRQPRTDRDQGAEMPAVVAMNVAQWRNGGWLQVPLRRTEINGDQEEYLPLQWRADRHTVEWQLAHAGWQPAPAWSVQAALGWLLPQTAAGDLPVLPRFSQGERSQLTFVRVDPRQPASRLVLRLWRYHYVVRDALGDWPLWYGTLYRETLRRPARLITVEQTDALAGTAEIAAALAARGAIVDTPAGVADAPPAVLLVSAPDDGG